MLARAPRLRARTLSAKPSLRTAGSVPSPRHHGDFLENACASSPGPPSLLRSEGLYHCDYCHKDLSSTLRIKCAVCKDFDLCLECFRWAGQQRQTVQAPSGDALQGSDARRSRVYRRPMTHGSTCWRAARCGHPLRRSRVLAHAAACELRATHALPSRLLRSVGVHLNVAGHSNDHAYKVVQSLGFPLYHPAWRVSPPLGRCLLPAWEAALPPVRGAGAHSA